MALGNITKIKKTKVVEVEVEVEEPVLVLTLTAREVLALCIATRFVGGSPKGSLREDTDNIAKVLCNHLNYDAEKASDAVRDMKCNYLFIKDDKDIPNIDELCRIS